MWLRPLLICSILSGFALLAACGQEESMEAAGLKSRATSTPESLWSEAAELPLEQIRWNDLPGVAGYPGLSKKARLQALAVANLQDCPCGCANHKVAQCLIQVEGCLTAETAAKQIVAEAALRWPSVEADPPDAASESGTAAESPPVASPPEDPAAPGQDPESLEQQEEEAVEPEAPSEETADGAELDGMPLEVPPAAPGAEQETD